MIVMVTMVAMVSQFVVFTYVAKLIHATINDGTRAVALTLLAFGIAGVTGNQLSGRLADGWGPSRTIRASIALMGVSFAGLAIMSQLDRSVIGAVITVALVLTWGVGGWGFLPAQQLRLVRSAPDAGPLVLSVNASSNYMGIALGGAIGGVVLAVASLTAVVLVGAAMAAVAVMLVGLGDE
jgi:MFS transporter, DHA1 family, inner membrane transport protein